MDLDELLGIDADDPVQALADRLVRADDDLLDDLIAERIRRGLSQAQVGELMGGISQSAVARIESGERDPHLSTLRRYALAVAADVRHVVEPFDMKVVQQQRVNEHLASTASPAFSAPYSSRGKDLIGARIAWGGR